MQHCQNLTVFINRPYSTDWGRIVKGKARRRARRRRQREVQVGIQKECPATLKHVVVAPCMRNTSIPEFEEVHVLITPEQQQIDIHLRNLEAKPTNSSKKETERARERERERETETE